jgi:hypothetical protein
MIVSAEDDLFTAVPPQLGNPKKDFPLFRYRKINPIPYPVNGGSRIFLLLFRKSLISPFT